MSRVRSYKKRVIDLVIVILLVVVASAATIFLNLNFLVATLLFFGVPSVYLIWRKNRRISKKYRSAHLYSA